MTTKSIKLFEIAIILSMVLLMIPNVVISDNNTGSTRTIALKQITSHPKGEYFPDIYENYIIWDDNRNGNFDIYMYDIRNGQEIMIINDPHPQYNGAIYGNYVVWNDFRKGEDNGDIYMYNINTGSETPVCTAPGQQFHCDIFENTIVWIDERNDGAAIFKYDIETGKETPVITHLDYPITPKIWEDRIVWCDNNDVYLHNITTNSTRQITSDAGSQRNPVIHEKIIVWADERLGHDNGDIYMFDLVENREIQITTNNADQRHPDIDGKNIVWEDFRNPGEYGHRQADVYLYDLSTGTEHQITSNIAYQEKPAIFGDKIVWEDRDVDGGPADIFMYNLTIAKKTAPSPPENIITDPEGISNTNSFSISWTNPTHFSSITGAYYSFDTPPISNTNGILTEGSDIEDLVDVSLPGEGEHTLYVWLRDSLGNADPYNHVQVTLGLDITPPYRPDNLSLDPSTWSNSRHFDLIWNSYPELSDNSRGYYKFDTPPKANDDGEEIDGVYFVPSKGITYFKLYYRGQEGAHTIYVWFKDEAGNVDFNNYSSTTLYYDCTPPEIVSVSPSVDSNNVTIDTNITMVFGESIHYTAETPKEINVLSSPSSLILGTTLYDPDNFTIRFVPDKVLEYGTTYSVFISTGIEDLARNGLNSTYKWNFTTEFDSDDDSFTDEKDAFPFDPCEWKDTDGDGVGDNSDAFPENPNEWLDTDEDGEGNNADIDDDGDYMPDVWEMAQGLNSLDRFDASNDTDLSSGLYK